MDWNHYQQQALTTAIYPLKRELEYTVFGLLSEVGELAEQMSPLGSPDEIPGELGDNFWYCAAIADALRAPLNDVYTYAETERLSDPYEHLTAITVLAGLIAGHVKKAIRDDLGWLNENRRRNIIACLSRIMHHLEFIGSDFGTTAGILNANLNKLSDRKARGVLQGSGDHR